MFLNLLLQMIEMSSCTLSGYEKYNTIRADPALCFVERVDRKSVV